MAQQSTELVPFQKRYDTFRGELAKRAPQIKQLLPKHVSTERITRILLTEAYKTPALLECSAPSLWGAVMQAAQLGLEPGGALGHCYLLPFRNKGVMTCTFVPGYKGYVELAHRSGRVSKIGARVVYVGDEFDYQLGSAEYIKHVPGQRRVEQLNDPKQILYAYAFIKLKGAEEPMIEVMQASEIAAIKARSRARDSGPWQTDVAAMSAKTALRKLCKFAPLTAEMGKAVALDELNDANLDQDFGDVIDLVPEPTNDNAAPQTLDDLKAAANKQEPAREPGEDI